MLRGPYWFRQNAAWSPAWRQAMIQLDRKIRSAGKKKQISNLHRFTLQIESAADDWAICFHLLQTWTAWCWLVRPLIGFEVWVCSTASLCYCSCHKMRWKAGLVFILGRRRLTIIPVSCTRLLNDLSSLGSVWRPEFQWVLQNPENGSSCKDTPAEDPLNADSLQGSEKLKHLPQFSSAAHSVYFLLTPHLSFYLFTGIQK